MRFGEFLARIGKNLPGSKSKPEKKPAKRLFRWLILAAALCSIFLLCLGFLNSSLLDVASVKVVNSERTTEQGILVAAEIEIGESLVFLDTKQVQKRVEDLPWVKGAEIDRSMNGVVTLTIEERSPVGVLVSDAGFVSVDNDGVQLEESTTMPAGNLLKIEGLEVSGKPGSMLSAESKGFMEISLQMNQFFPNMLEDFVRRDGQLEASIKNSGSVEFGQPDLVEEKKVALQTVLNEVDLICVDGVDVQVPSIPILTRVEGCEDS